MSWSIIFAALLWQGGANGVSLTLESETKAINPAESVFVSVTLTTPRGVTATPPDLRGRVRGFSLAEDFAEEPETRADGTTVQVVRWRFEPEPCADVYAIRPFCVTYTPPVQGAFVAGPVRFEGPSPRESVTGAMEVNPKKDWPPLSGRLIGLVALFLALAAGGVYGLFVLGRLLARRVKEHRMSPIERAWVELDRLIRKGLPNRGRYKDFYVELTLVVRRYVQRRYGIRAPHLTTEEFFAEAVRSGGATAERLKALRTFLDSADLVKFAGVDATNEMADEATTAARGYLKRDAQLADAREEGKK